MSDLTLFRLTGGMFLCTLVLAYISEQSTGKELEIIQNNGLWFILTIIFGVLSTVLSIVSVVKDKKRKRKIIWSLCVIISTGVTIVIAMTYGLALEFLKN